MLAGDWLYTGMGGTMESAVMAGMMASRALCDRRCRAAEDAPLEFERHRIGLFLPESPTRLTLARSERP